MVTIDERQTIDDCVIEQEDDIHRVASFAFTDFSEEAAGKKAEHAVLCSSDEEDEYSCGRSSSDPDLIDYDLYESDTVDVKLEQFTETQESPECAEVVFVKEGVAIYRSKTDKIVGKLSLLKQKQVLYISWLPSNRNSVKNSPPGALSPRGKERTLYAVHPIALSDIKALRKCTPSFGMHYIYLVLVTGLTLPPFYFLNGGIKALIKTLKQYITLNRSNEDPNTYLIRDLDDPLVHGLDLVSLGNAKTEVETWDTSSQNLSSRMWSQFSKSIRRVQDSTASFLSSIDLVLKEQELGEGGEQEVTSNRRDDIQAEISSVRKHSVAAKHVNSWTSLELEFELLDDIPELQAGGSRASTKRSPPLGKESFMALFDEEGLLSQWDTFNSLVHAGGMDMELRRSVWKYLLGVYPQNSTCDQRDLIDKEMIMQYKKLKSQWRQIKRSDQEQRFCKFKERRVQIEKDVRRTDRQHAFYGVHGQDWRSNEQLLMLYNILMTYVMYNFDIGYVQGMSDLASPILYIVYKGFEWDGLPAELDKMLRLRMEAEAFWMFSALMWKVESHFDKDQRGVILQLETVQRMLCKLDPHLHSHLTDKGCEDLLQCFRWLFVLFKREFKFEEVLHLWEVSWSCEINQHFQLYVCITILLMNRKVILEEVEDITDFLNICCNHSQLDVQRVIREAKRLCEFTQRFEQHNFFDSLVQNKTPPPFTWNQTL